MAIHNCPNCSHRTFHLEESIRKCKCGAVGFQEKPDPPGKGRGARCGSCGKDTVRVLAMSKAFLLKHCYGCETTFVLPPEAPV